jgi:hypothetical protein
MILRVIYTLVDLDMCDRFVSYRTSLYSGERLRLELVNFQEKYTYVRVVEEKC